MTFAESRSDTVPVELPNGAIAKFEVTTTGREDVSFDAKQFQPVADAIEGVVQMVAAPLKKARPKKATVKFGMEMAIEAGQLTAVIVKGSGKANLEITLEWEAQPKT
ncbi:MAG: CU044_2847 family protein [Coleofasciculus sp. C2-GNP5-27]|uniref:CU044_2847 family protein n=1 Tax=Coleofasciculus sp. B1-GNL1-01 TaxID=3068484 RepID=UPI0032FFF3D0